jgi:predicted ribosomally synthesized peptide with SipW-like signal peptide
LTGALANSQSPTPDNVLTGGLAGVAKYVSLAATIASNAKSAINIVKSGNASSASLGGGGGTSASFSNSASSQNSFLNQSQPTLIQPQLLSQFSQPVQDQQDLVNAASSQPTVNSVVSVVDIKKGLQSNVTKVKESSL